MNIITKRLIVREILIEDGPSILKYSQEETNKRFLPNEFFDSLEEVNDLILNFQNNYENEQFPLVYGVEYNNQYIGHVSYSTINGGKDLEIGYSICEQYQNLGFAKELIIPITKYAKRFPFDAVYGVCLNDNVASKKVLAFAGYTHLYDEEEKAFGGINKVSYYRFPLKLSIRFANENDIPRIMEVVQDAQLFLHNQGINQWQDGFPNPQVIKDDINMGEAYVFLDQDVIVAYLALEVGFSDNYEHLFGGSWLTENERYGTIHRTAIVQEYRGKGLGGFMFDFSIKRCQELGLNNVRIDTHEHNKLMQHLINKYGFSYRGIIYLPKSGAKRLAYEIVFEEKKRG